MKSMDEFKKYYETDMLPLLKPLEEKRKSIHDRVKKVSIIFIIAYILLSIIFYIKINVLGMFMIIFGPGVIIGLIYGPPYYYTRQREYYDEFKKIVIGNTVKFFGESFTYNPSGYIELSDFVESDLFKRKTSSSEYRYYGEDLVTGYINSVKITFSEVKAILYGGGRTRMLFKGLFFVLTFPEVFKEKNLSTTVSPDQSDINNTYLSKESSHLIKCLSKQYINLSIKGSKMYIAAELWQQNLFEPRIDKSLLDFNEVNMYFIYLKFALETVEGLLKKPEIWDNQ